MSPKPPVNVNGVRFAGPRYVHCGSPYCRNCNETPATPPPAPKPRTRWADAIGWGLFGATIFLVLALLALCGVAANAQTLPTTAPTTRPAGRIPVCSWFQPKRNLQMLHDQGVWVHFGPEVENAGALPLPQLLAKEDEWIREVERLGDRCVLKRPRFPLSTAAVGVLLADDEPNSKGVPPSRVRDAAKDLKAQFPGVDVYLSLAGDRITSANLERPAEWAQLAGYLEAADVVTTNTYEANRNAPRYQVTREKSWTRDCVAKLKRYFPSTRVVPWVEINDQQLQPPPKPADGFSRAPTAQEIEDKVEGALDAGAEGFGYFATSRDGKYGWGGVGDSYWPLFDRNRVSLQPQLDRAAALARKYGGRPVDPELLAARARVAELEAERARTAAGIEGALKALTAATQPATRPAGAGQ